MGLRVHSQNYKVIVETSLDEHLKLGLRKVMKAGPTGRHYRHATSSFAFQNILLLLTWKHADAYFLNLQLRLEGVSSNRMGPFAVVLEVVSSSSSVFLLSSHNFIQLFSFCKVHSYQVFEVAPSLFMVDVRKVAGDTLEYHRVCSLILYTSNCFVGDTLEYHRALFCVLSTVF